MTVTRDGEIMRLARTMAQLQPGQGGQRLRLRLQRLALNRSVPAARRWLLAGPNRMTGPGWPGGFTPLDAGGRSGSYRAGTRAGRGARDGEPGV